MTHRIHLLAALLAAEDEPTRRRSLDWLLRDTRPARRRGLTRGLGC